VEYFVSAFGAGAAEKVPRPAGILPKIYEAQPAEDAG